MLHHVTFILNSILCISSLAEFQMLLATNINQINCKNLRENNFNVMSLHNLHQGSSLSQVISITPHFVIFKLSYLAIELSILLNLHNTCIRTHTTYS